MAQLVKSLAVCGGLNGKSPPQAQTYQHLVNN